MGHARLKSSHFFFVHNDETVLGTNILVRLSRQEHFFQNREESFWVRIKEPTQKLFVCAKSDYVVDVAAPFKSCKLASWEFLPFKEERNHPKQFVTDVSRAMFNFELFLSVLNILLELLLFFS